MSTKKHNQKSLVILQIFNTRLEAEIVRGKLQTSGIKTVITADDEGGMAPYPMSPSSNGVKLYVDKKDYEKAKKILNELV